MKLTWSGNSSLFQLDSLAPHYSTVSREKDSRVPSPGSSLISRNIEDMPKSQLANSFETYQSMSTTVTASGIFSSWNLSIRAMYSSCLYGSGLISHGNMSVETEHTVLGPPVAQGPPGQNRRWARNRIERGESSSMISTKAEDVDVASSRLSGDEPSIVGE